MLWMQIQDIILLQLHEHNQKNLWRRWWLSLLVASIYSLLSELLLLWMWRFYSVRDEDQLWCKEICFLLDTTTFSTIRFSLQFSCLGSFMRGLLHSWCSVARWADSIRQLFYKDSFRPCHGFSLSSAVLVYKMSSVPYTLARVLFAEICASWHV